MASTTTSTRKDVSKNLLPIPDLENMAVGHAVLYPVEGELSNESSDVDVLEPIINIGIGKGEKILLDVEPGVKAFIKDGLAKKVNSELEKYGLSKDMERVKAIPSSMTGALLYYLTQGIERDFGITWVTPPVSIKEKDDKLVKDKKKGTISLSKNEKNELIAQLKYEYYEDDINSGLITQQEAFAAMAVAAEKKKKYEDAGYFLSPNKTKGVSLFDWKSSVIEAHGKDDATKVYTRNKVEILIPNLIENYYSSDSKPKKLSKELGKSVLFFTKGVGDVLSDGTALEPEVVEITSDGDLYKFIKDNGNFNNTIETIDKEYNIKGFHLTKIAASGMMKPRQICIDCISKKDQKQHLFLLDRDGGVLHYQ